MKKIVCLICFVFIVMSCSFNIVIAKTEKTVIVPKNTEVIVGVKRKKSQKTISDEYTLIGIIKKDVFVKGVKVFSVHDKVKIFVSENNKAKFRGEGGTLVLDGAYAFDTNKNKHQLALHEEYVGKDRTIWAKIFFFRKGENVILFPSLEIKAKTVDNFKFKYVL